MTIDQFYALKKGDVIVDNYKSYKLEIIDIKYADKRKICFFAPYEAVPQNQFPDSLEEEAIVNYFSIDECLLPTKQTVSKVLKKLREIGSYVCYRYSNEDDIVNEVIESMKDDYFKI